jgi:hypothetical protein
MSRRTVAISVGVGLLILIAAALYTQLAAMSCDSLESALRAHGAAVQHAH